MVEPKASQARVNGLPVVRRIPLVRIDAVVATNLGPARVRGNAQPAVFCRQIAMYLAKHVGGWSTTRIGKFYNGRDHSTVCYAIRRIEALRKTDPDLNAVIDSLAKSCQEEKPPVREPEHQAAARNLHEAVLGQMDNEFLEVLADRIADRVLTRLNAQLVDVPQPKLNQEVTTTPDGSGS